MFCWILWWSCFWPLPFHRFFFLCFIFNSNMKLALIFFKLIFPHEKVPNFMYYSCNLKFLLLLLLKLRERWPNSKILLARQNLSRHSSQRGKWSCLINHFLHGSLPPRWIKQCYLCAILAIMTSSAKNAIGINCAKNAIGINYHLNSIFLYLKLFLIGPKT